MKVKIHFKDVNSHVDKVLAVKIYYYIDNAMRNSEWLLSEEAKNYDYDQEWERICIDIGEK